MKQGIQRSGLRALLAVSLLSATMAAQPSTVILVRHAEKASATEKDPELSPAGMERARSLAAELSKAGVTSIITTQLVRTKQTAAPLAGALQITPIVVPNSGNTAAHVAAVVAAVMARPAGSTVLVVGHSNTVTAIIRELGGPRLGDICDSQYANLYTLVRPTKPDAALLVKSYGVADPADPACVKR